MRAGAGIKTESELRQLAPLIASHTLGQSGSDRLGKLRRGPSQGLEGRQDWWGGTGQRVSIERRRRDETNTPH